MELPSYNSNFSITLYSFLERGMRKFALKYENLLGIGDKTYEQVSVIVGTSFIRPRLSIPLNVQV